MKKLAITERQFFIIKEAYQKALMILMFGLIVLQGYLQAKMLETVFCVTAFLLLSYFYSFKLHSYSMAKCFVGSILLFAILTRVALVLDSSLLFAPILGLITAYFLTKIAAYIFKSFVCATATIDEFKTRCREKGLNLKDINFAIDALSCERVATVQELANKYYYALNSAAKKKTALKKCLEEK